MGTGYKNKGILFLATSTCSVGLLLVFLCFFRDYSLFSINIYINLFIMFILLVFPPVLAKMKGKFDYFEAINFFILTFFIGYFIISLVVIIDLSRIPLNDREYFLFVFSIDNFGKSLLLSNVCLASVLCGYYAVRLNHSNTEHQLVNDDFNIIRAKKALIFMSVIYFSAIIIRREILGPMISRGFSYFFGYGIFVPFTALGLCIPFFYYIFFISRGKHYLWSSIISTIVLFNLFTSGSRGGILLPIFTIIISRHYLVKKFNLKNAIFLSVFVTVIMVYVGEYRLESFKRFDIGQLQESAVPTLISTFYGLPSFMLILDRIPDIQPYYHGQAHLESLVWPIFPRIFFPQKPEIYGIGRFWEDAANMISSGNSFFVSLPGQFYMDFGILGIIVGSFLTGMFLKIIYVTFMSNRNFRGAVFLYVIFLFAFVYMAPFGISTTYMFLERIVIPYFLFRYVYGKPLLPLPVRLTYSRMNRQPIKSRSDLF